MTITVDACFVVVLLLMTFNFWLAFQFKIKVGNNEVNIKKTSLKRVNLNIANTLFKISPESYSITKKMFRDHFVIVTFEQQMFFGSVQCIQIESGDVQFYVKLGTKSYIRNGMNVKEVTNGLFDLVEFETASVKVNSRQIINKAIGNCLDNSNRYFVTELILKLR